MVLIDVIQYKEKESAATQSIKEMISEGGKPNKA